MDTCYDNTTVTGWQHGFPDALARLAGTGMPPPAERRTRERLDLDLTDPSEYAALRSQGQDRRLSQHVARLLRPWDIPSLWASDEPSALAACPKAILGGAAQYA
eukprot:gene39243-48473_t